MRKLYSIVLTACALLLSTSLFAVDVTTRQQIQDAINGGIGSNDPVNIVLKAEIDVDVVITIQDGQTVNIDLNGFNMTAGNPTVFILKKGTLNITGTGTISKSGKGSGTGETDAIRVLGSIVPEDANYSNLTIGENVIVLSSGPQSDGKETTNAITIIEQGSSSAEMMAAYGVNIHIKGTVHGTKYGIKLNGNINKETGEIPYVKVWPSAHVYSAPSTSNAIAIYSSGYGKFDIMGNVHGATGVCIKGGIVNFIDAIVKSDYTIPYQDPDARRNAKGKEISSGIEAGGSAIVIASQKSYPGHQVTISGDTKVIGGSGYAIDEALLANSGTKVESVNITGGTIEAGKEGAIIITEETSNENNKVQIVGGNIQNEVYIRDEGGTDVTSAPVDMFTPTTGNYNTTAVTDPETGKTTIVVTKLEDGVTIDKTGMTIANAAAAVPAQGLKWTGDNEDIDANITLPYLEINENKVQTVTVKGGKTLKVGRIVMGTKAQIIVEAGARLIVDGEQGIVAPVASNIILETQEGKPAQFLFNPAVTSNRHPNATVEFISKSYRVNNDNKFFQRFGIPATLESIEFDGDASIQTAVSNPNYTSGEWELTGIINGTPALNASNLNKTFTYYQMLTNAPVSETGYKFRMKGALVGNDSPELDILGHTWYGLANSYMGKMDIVTLLAAMPASFVNMAVYTYAPVGDNQYAWEAVSEDTYGDDFTEIDPMQPFLVYNKGARASMTTNYQNMVWAPANPSGNAPVRREAKDWTKAQVLVSNPVGRVKKVTVIESAEFTTPSTAVKFMNEDMNLYVSGDEKCSIVSTDDMNNTYLGFSCTEAGTYTVNFKHLTGESLTLIDLKNGAQVAVSENDSYEFYAEAGAEDYRFVIVKSAKAPTALENAEVAEKVAGVYSITGQYMGTMAEWNTLPAGIYVVNGEKRIR